VVLENPFTNTGTIWGLLRTALFAVELYEGAKFPLILIIIIHFAVMMLARAVTVYGGSTFLRIFKVRIPLQWQNVLTLGGLRGGMAVALVLSLPSGYELKPLFISLVIPLIAINLVANPILLAQYLKKSKIA
jgi:monovalent cation:H+ antiporter, CPA1 family